MTAGSVRANCSSLLDMLRQVHAATGGFPRRKTPERKIEIREAFNADSTIQSLARKYLDSVFQK
jgi:hypothetical protein